MKFLTFIVVFLISFFSSYGQFVITEVPMDKKNDTLIIKEEISTFYEDEKYVVSRSCSGEFGGTVKFRNKQTGVERSCSSVCAVAINKIADSYFVSSSLAHLVGFAEVVEIKDPETMEIFKMPPPRKKKRKVIFRYVGDNESRSTTGSISLADSIGMDILTSFVYNTELYHITTDFHKTFLSTIKDNKFVTLNLVSDRRLRPSLKPSYQKGSLLIPFTSDSGNGRIEITDNRIQVKKFK